MWRPADIMALIMIGTICFTIGGGFVHSWVTGGEFTIERVHVIRGLFVGMFGLVAYRMGKNHD